MGELKIEMSSPIKEPDFLAEFTRRLSSNLSNEAQLEKLTKRNRL